MFIPNIPLKSFSKSSRKRLFQSAIHYVCTWNIRPVNFFSSDLSFNHALPANTTFWEWRECLHKQTLYICQFCTWKFYFMNVDFSKSEKITTSNKCLRLSQNGPKSRQLLSFLVNSNILSHSEGESMQLPTCPRKKTKKNWERERERWEVSRDQRKRFH